MVGDIQTRVTQSDSVLCVDMTDLHANRHTRIEVRGELYKPCNPSAFTYIPPSTRADGTKAVTLPLENWEEWTPHQSEERRDRHFKWRNRGQF